MRSTIGRRGSAADDVFVHADQVDLAPRSGSAKSLAHWAAEAVMSMPWGDAITAVDRDGFSQSLQVRARLSGRITDVVVAQPPGIPARVLPDHVARWRSRALRDGIVTETGL